MRVYPHRAPRGDCDHRDSGGHPVPGLSPRRAKKARQTSCLIEREATWACLHPVLAGLWDEQLPYMLLWCRHKVGRGTSIPMSRALVFIKCPDDSTSTYVLCEGNNPAVPESYGYEPGPHAQQRRRRLPQLAVLLACALHRARQHRAGSTRSAGAPVDVTTNDDEGTNGTVVGKAARAAIESPSGNGANSFSGHWGGGNWQSR